MFGYHFERRQGQLHLGLRVLAAHGRRARRSSCAAARAHRPPDGCLPAPDGLARFQPRASAHRHLPPPAAGHAGAAHRARLLRRSAEGGDGQRSLQRQRERSASRTMALRVDRDRGARSCARSPARCSPTQPVRARDARDQRLRRRPRAVPRAGLRRRHAHRGAAVRRLAPRPAATSTPPAPTPTSSPGAYACPTGSTSRSFSLAGLPADGQHDVRVDVEDAAGNRTVALERTATFDLPVDGLRCPADGCVAPRRAPNGAQRHARRRAQGHHHGPHPPPRRPRPAHHDRRPLATRAGAPISGRRDRRRRASSDAPGAAWQPAGSVRTDANGRFRYAVPSGPARIVAPRPTARTSATPSRPATPRSGSRVRAGVTVAAAPGSRAPRRPRARPRTAARRRRPRAGTLVELQALDGREWRTFKTLPVPPRTLRLPLPLPPHHRAAPASCGASTSARRPGLPYAAAASRPCWVLVRPMTRQRVARAAAAAAALALATVRPHAGAAGADHHRPGRRRPRRIPHPGAAAARPGRALPRRLGRRPQSRHRTDPRRARIDLRRHGRRRHLLPPRHLRRDGRRSGRQRLGHGRRLAAAEDPVRPSASEGQRAHELATPIARAMSALRRRRRPSRECDVRVDRARDRRPRSWTEQQPNSRRSRKLSRTRDRTGSSSSPRQATTAGAVNVPASLPRRHRRRGGGRDGALCAFSSRGPELDVAALGCDMDVAMLPTGDQASGRARASPRLYVAGVVVPRCVPTGPISRLRQTEELW